jgi:hypothetical protein
LQTIDNCQISSASLVPPRSKQRLISKVKKATPISIPTPTDTPLVSVEHPNTLVRRHRENLKRSCTKRLPLNVRELDNVGNYCTTVDTSENAYDNFFIASLVKELDDAPKNRKAAIQSNHHKEDWKAAMDAEIKSLIDLETWEIVDTPKGCKLKTYAFIFNKKYTGTNSIKYKPRLVAHGYRQVYGLDYWETYAPVSSTTSIRTILALAANNNMLIH